MLEQEPLILAIAGASGSGKTTLAQTIKQHFGDSKAALISLDSYYRPLTHLSIEERARINFDHPDALEISLLEVHLSSIKQGLPIAVPSYDFAQHDRIGEPCLVSPRKLIIVEGILALAFARVREIYSIRVFVETALPLCFERRLERDIRERGRTRESVYRQWAESVAPMYQEYCCPSKAYADIVCSGEDKISKAARQVITALDEL